MSAGGYGQPAAPAPEAPPTDARVDLAAAWTMLLALHRRLRVQPTMHEAVRISRRGEITVPEDGSGSSGLGVDPTGDPRWIRTTPSAEAASLVDLYLPLILSGAGRRFVIGQLGQSLDGQIATRAGHSHYVTGPPSLDHLHRLRALCDAVVVGGATVAADDPQLTVRRVAGDHPVRVVIDPDRRLAADRRLLQDGQAPTLVAVRGGSPASDREFPVPVSKDGRGLDPTALLDALAERGLHWVLVEGGGITVSRFLAAGALDRLQIAVAPMIVGSGRPGLVPGVAVPPIERLDQALRPPARWIALGDDILCDLDLRGRT